MWPGDSCRYREGITEYGKSAAVPQLRREPQGLLCGGIHLQSVLHERFEAKRQIGRGEVITRVACRAAFPSHIAAPNPTFAKAATSHRTLVARRQENGKCRLARARRLR